MATRLPAPWVLAMTSVTVSNMQRATIMAILRSVSTIRHDVEVVRRKLDDEALQVGDRVMIDRTLHTIGSEFEVLDRTLSEMLTDPTKVE